MTRSVALKHLKVALLKGDVKAATSIYIGNRISRAVYNRYYRDFYKAAKS